MKSLTLFIFLSIFFDGNLFAQNSSQTFYYPLNIGDFWEYERRTFTFSVIESRKVIGDSLMPNGKMYRVIRRMNPISASKIYQRIVDSTLVYQLYERFEPPNEIIYDEFLLYKLDLMISEAWPYPPGGFDGFIADSGFVEVRQIQDLILWSNRFTSASLGSFTLPDSALWFDPDVILVDSIGVLEDAFEGGSFRLHGAIINNKKYGTITSVKSYENSSSDNAIKALYNYPNPFNNSTTIEYRVKNAGKVKIAIFNVLGERIKVLNDRFQASGHYKVNWNGDNDLGFRVASGNYFYLLEVNGVTIETSKLSYVK